MQIAFEYLAEFSKIGGRLKELDGLKNGLIYADEVVVNDQEGTPVGKFVRDENDEWRLIPDEIYFT